MTEVVKTLGDVRVLVAEVLFAVLEADSKFSAEGINFIHDSTFHILVIWALDKHHNSIYIAKFLQFIALFCRKANSLTLVNSIIKTNLLSDLGGFALHKLFGGVECEPYRVNCMYYFRDLVEAIFSIENREECALFNSEVNKSVNWKYLKEAFK